MSLRIRDLGPDDTPVLARLHTLSWSSAYRGIIPDAWLDEELAADRVAFWQARAEVWPDRAFGLLALDGEQPVGFVFALPGADPTWGTLIDNLHVLPGWKGRGIGRQLMARFATELIDRGDSAGVFLWVYEKNTAARQFYEIVGGKKTEETDYPAPGGGEARIYRMTWSSPEELIARTSKEGSGEN